MRRVLEKINTPKDLKMLSKHELVQLCGEIREQLLKRMSVTGGHVGSNLAVVEATAALHYVFLPIPMRVYMIFFQSGIHRRQSALPVGWQKAEI